MVTSRGRVILGAFLVAAVVVAATLAVVTRHSSGTVATAAPTVGKSEAVVPGTDDNLDPLPAGTKVPMSVDEVIAKMKASNLLVSYLEDPNLSAESGVYSNPNLRDGDGKATSNVIAYVIKATGPCAPGGEPSLASEDGSTSTTTGGLVRCAATIVVDGTTAEPLMLNEVGSNK